MLKHKILFFFSCFYSASLLGNSSFWENWRQSPHFTGNWGGYRDKFHEHGIDFTPTWSMDFGWNIARTHTKRYAYQYLLDLNLQIDSAPWTNDKGGLLYVDFQSHHGKSLSQYLHAIEDIDSYIDAPSFVQLSELWYKQSFFEKALTIKIGKSDAAEEFDSSYYGSPFLNGGFESI